MVDLKIRGSSKNDPMTLKMACQDQEKGCFMALPIITYKNKSYFFDYKLQELREIKTIRSIFLNVQELELFAYAIEQKSKRLIKINFQEIEYKL